MKRIAAITLVFLASIILAAIVSPAQAAILTISQGSGPDAGACDNSAGASGLGQSFMATATGNIVAIRVSPSATGAGNLSIGTENQPVNFSTAGGWFNIPLTTPQPVTAGTTYTFYVTNTGCAGSTARFYFHLNDDFPGQDVYPGGVLYTGGTATSYDLMFEVDIDDGAGGGPAPASDGPPDNRINWKHGDTYGIFVPRHDENGNPVLHLYCISAEGQGTLGDIITQEMFDKAPAEPATNTQIGETNACRVPIKYYVLTTGEYQINIGADWEGKVDVIIFTGLPPSHVYFRYLNWAAR